MSRKPKVFLYLLGPMTGYFDENRPAFNRWAKFLRAEGFDVFNPAELDEQLGPTTRAGYYQRDAQFLAKADGGAAIPGWELSKGAKWEAYTLGVMFEKPVYQLPDMALIVPDFLPRLEAQKSSHLMPPGDTLSYHDGS